jgi:hypothetical protein
MSDTERRQRAEQRRQRAVINRARLGEVEPDLHPIRGVEAISLVTRLTRESWSLSGRPWPEYTRSETPYRFVPGWPE